MMAQTREFPTMHVMRSMDVSVVVATSAAWDMIEGCHASFNGKEKNMSTKGTRNCYNEENIMKKEEKCKRCNANVFYLIS